MFRAIVTQRLVLRSPTISDLDALIERRNDPAVAEYQDWLLPFDRETALDLLTNVAAMDGPTPGEWWMVTIADRQRPDEAPLGDLAVHLSDDGRAAEIGYTFAVANQGRGFATEAVAALIDHLFDDVGVARVAASLHPDNVASAMVLERTGFHYEGQTRLSHWLGEGDDAVNSDGMFYGLVEDDYRRWRARPTAPPRHVGLVEITADNQHEISGLVTHKSQERLVAPVLQSYGDALFPERVNGAPVVPWLRAIEADGDPVGFVMVAWGSEHHPNPYLWRLLIDRMHQRRGIGNRALDLVEDSCRAGGSTAIEVTWTEGRGSPGPFYEARGYVRTGRVVDGETEAIKQLS
jgi:RimJ/RimL family protein N-acetyltransferase